MKTKKAIMGITLSGASSGYRVTAKSDPRSNDEYLRDLFYDMADHPIKYVGMYGTTTETTQITLRVQTFS